MSMFLFGVVVGAVVGAVVAVVVCVVVIPFVEYMKHGSPIG